MHGQLNVDGYHGKKIRYIICFFELYLCVLMLSVYTHYEKNIPGPLTVTMEIKQKITFSRTSDYFH